MNTSVIFAVISALLMLTIYTSSLTLEVSGATRGKIYCLEVPGQDKVQCCQTEFDDEGNPVTTWCTTCDNTDPPSKCTPRTANSGEADPGRELSNTLQGGVLKDPSTIGPLEEEQDEKTGGVFKQPKSNDTFSQDDIGNLE